MGKVQEVEVYNADDDRGMQFEFGDSVQELEQICLC